MTDRYDHDLLLDYLEGDLAPGDRAQVDKMLADDPQLAALMRGLAGDRAALRAMPSEPAPGDLSFDLVQGLERRMLLDAPQVDRSGGAAGPIPISRGRTQHAARGVRWSRVGGVLGMAAALGLATGLVIYFNMSDPLTRTALEMNDQPASGQPTADAEQAPADAATEAGDLAALSAPGATGGGAATNAQPSADLPETNTNLAARAREAILSGGQPESPSVANATPAAAGPQPAALAEGFTSPVDLPGRGGAATEPVLALTAYAPDRALRIASDNPGLSREQVVAWAVNNGVPVVEPKANHADANTLGAAAGQEQIALLIEEDQLDSLILAVNAIEVQPARNQRAEIGAVDEDIYGYAQLDGRAVAFAEVADEAAEQEDAAEPGAAAAQPQAAPAQQVVSLKVPDDLGDEFLNRQNVANTYQFTNQDELALAAQRDAEVARNRQQRAAAPVAPAPPVAAVQEQADPVLLAGERARRGGGAAGGAADQGEPLQERAAPDGPGNRGDRPAGNGGANTPADLESPPAEGATVGEGASEAESQAELDHDPQYQREMRDAERGESLTQEESTPGSAQEPQDGADDSPRRSPIDARRGAGDAHHAQPARRGNWLMPQMPLADSAPIVTDPPSARLVPIVFILERLRPDPATGALREAAEEADQADDAASAQPDSADAEVDSAQPPAEE